MRVPFVRKVLTRLLREELVHKDQAILAVCAGIAEQDLFREMGFSNVTLSNVEVPPAGPETDSLNWAVEDAQELSFPDGQFDISFVSDGLHHCSAPHSALLEMYRVAKKGVIVVESRDSILMRLAILLGLTPAYELEAVFDHGGKTGGVNNTGIPNYIYRWTEHEFRKVIRSFDPCGRHTFRFFYGLNLPYQMASFHRNPAKLVTITLLSPLVRTFTWILPRQCNSLAMVALKPHDIWPWLKRNGDSILFDLAYVGEHLKKPGHHDAASARVCHKRSNEPASSGDTP